MRLIDADELLERLRNAEAFYKHDTAGDFDMGRGLGLNEAQQKVAEQPAIEAEPVKHGRWVKHRIEKYDNYGNYTNAPGLTDCSNCNFAAYGIAEIYNFCPQCGVRMDGDDNA